MLKTLTLSLVSAITLIAILVIGDNYLSRYISWRALSPTLISESSQWYMENRANDVDDIIAICVYALDCAENSARLTIVPDPDQYDFETLRQLIWARRFNGTCIGQSANLGLHLLRSSLSDGNPGSDRAIWSFYLNRFIPKSGNWSGGAFSEEPWERCSMERAAYSVEEGVLYKTSN